MQEIWKDIPNYDGCYQISSLGRVKSLLFNKERILKCSINKYGYSKITIHKNKRLVYYEIHYLVALAFLNYVPIRNKICVDHIDRNKLNNNVNNLRIVTIRENVLNTERIINSSLKINNINVYINWCKYKKSWRCKLKHDTKFYHIGYIKDRTLAEQISNRSLHYFNEHGILPKKAIH